MFAKQEWFRPAESSARPGFDGTTNKWLERNYGIWGRGRVLCVRRIFRHEYPQPAGEIAQYWQVVDLLLPEEQMKIECPARASKTQFRLPQSRYLSPLCLPMRSGQDLGPKLQRTLYSDNIRTNSVWFEPLCQVMRFLPVKESSTKVIAT